MFEAIEPNNSLLDANVDDDSAYGLSAAATSTGGPIYVEGTLNADTFSLAPGYEATIVSGNGNIDYGTGVYDTLDLSEFSEAEVTDFNLASVTEGGTVLDVGDGARVFDYINLADGRQVVFEGIEKIVFSDQTYDLTVAVDDPYFEDQWNLHMMGVQTAWDFTTGTEDVLIGVQDTGLGVDPTGDIHPDLQPDGTWILSDNFEDDFFREAGEGNGELQENSHGTSVQGIISAEADNGIGLAGINQNSDVYSIDVLDGNVGDLELAGATQSMIDQATADGQKLVINMSLGGGGPDPALEALIAANQDDVLFVIAAGNGGDDQVADSLEYPAVYAQQYDNVIAVGAYSGTTGAIATYSNRGEGITLTGPTDVLTTNASYDGELSYNPAFNGTSAAAPNVSGVASLVWSANSDLSATQVKQILSETAYDLGTEGYDLTHGAGFVNADAAVRRAIAIEPDVADASLNPDIAPSNIDNELARSSNVDFSVQQPSSTTTFSTSNYQLNQTINQNDTETETNLLALSDSKPTSLFDYDAPELQNLVKLDGQLIQEDLLSGSLYQ